MRTMRMRVLTAALAALSAGMLFADQKTAFRKLADAQAAFKTNGSARVRLAAYEYVCSRLPELQNAAAGLKILSAARAMAQSLKRPADIEKHCRATLLSTNRTVRVVAAAYLCDELKGRAFPASERELRVFFADADGDAELQAIALSRLIDVYLSVKRPDDAAETAAAVLAFGSDAPPATRLSAGYVAAEAALRKGDRAAAEKLLLQTIEQRADIPSGFAQRVIKMNIPAATALSLVACLRGKIAAAGVSDSTGFFALAEKGGVEIFHLLRFAGKLEEALSECRILTMLSRGDAYRQAVIASAEMLKVLDGNLGRAGRCLAFYRKDAVPGTKNVLLAFPKLSCSARRALLRKLESVPPGKGWKARLERTNYYIWADAPQKAVVAALSAFAVAPTAQKELQTCANAAQGPILTLSRDPAKACRVVSYLMLGRAGADGVEGTSDDLEHPVAGLEAYMALCGRREDRPSE